MADLMDACAEAAEDEHVQFRAGPLACVTTASVATFLVLAATTSAASTGEIAIVLILPLSFAVAGLIGLDRRPESLAAAALTAVGLCHLLAFLFVAVAVIAGRRELPELEVPAAVLGATLYLSGFVAIIALALTLPSQQTVSRWPRLVLLGLLVLAVVTPAFAATFGDTQRLVLTLTGWPQRADGGGIAPSLSFLEVLAAPLLAAPVVAALVVAWRYRRSTGVTRRRLRWPAACFVAVLAVVVVQQLVGRDLPVAVSDALFVAALGAAPFTVLPSVLAGPVDDERLAAAVRTALVLALVWTGIAIAYAAVVAATGASSDVRRPAATLVVVVVGCASLLPRVRLLVARAADRLALGPPVDSVAMLREYGGTLALPDGLTTLCTHTAHVLRTALGAAWAEMILHSGEQARAGTYGHEAVPALRVMICDGDTAVGELRCGRRRRGPYGQRDLEAVEVLAQQAALAVRSHRLADELTHRLEELTVSRHRLAAAGDAERRRIERDLHDGAQQDLVALLSRVELARTVLGYSVEETAHTLDELREDVTRSIGSLRRTVLGIHPPVLTDRGLVAAVMNRASELPIDVDVEASDQVRSRRFPSDIEATAYYVIVESLTNVLKHAGVQGALVRIDVFDDTLVIQIADLGRGGASALAGTGLAGLADRLAAVDGTLEVISPATGGTRVSARLPVNAGAGRPA